MKTITRDEAFALLKKYNKDPFHIQHALTVEAVMKWYASELGYGEDAEYWGIVGLLHDIDSPPATITAASIRSSASCRKYPARSPVIPPNCFIAM